MAWSWFIATESKPQKRCVLFSSDRILKEKPKQRRIMEEKVITYRLNPNIDFYFGFISTKPIPTKQDKFAPIKIETYYEIDESILNNLYVKKPEIDSIIEFNKEIYKIASKIFSKENKISKPNNVEVIISVSVTEKRFKEVDIDNLSKCVLDSLNNIAFEDDVQVTSLIANKHIHPMKVNAILIGITKLTESRKGLLSNIKI